MKLAAAIVAIATAKSVDYHCADLIGKGYETSKYGVLHRAFELITCDPTLAEGHPGWTPVQGPYDGFVKCTRELEKSLAVCEEMENGPLCDESSPDFNAIECAREVTTCALNAFGDFARCLEIPL